MDYKNLNINTWNELNEAGDIVSGYYGTFLSRKEGEKSNLLIFKDERENLHFVIADDSVAKKEIPDPKVNGLTIELKKYHFQEFGVKQFIDIECSLKAYVNEFTEVIREIAEKIFARKESSIKSISDVINSWKSFWAAQIRQVLSEEYQIGLICELVVLKKLCEINPVYALSSWKGPLKEKYDFIFSDWVFEVKGTRKECPVHTINGLDQLKQPSGKNLALISFLATKSNGATSKSLQDWIEDIETTFFKSKVDLIEQFYNLLTGCGYSRVHKEEYRKVKFDIYDGKFFTVNENFPKLTSDYLKQPLDCRVSEIQYTIDLEGLSGEVFEYISFGKYFY